MTAFRAQNVPPPMSSYQLALPGPPVHVAPFPTRDSVVVLFPRGQFQVWDLKTRIAKQGSRGGGKVAQPEMVQDGHFVNDQVVEYRQVAGDAQGRVYALVTLRGGEDGVLDQDGELWVSENPVGRIASGLVEGVTSIDAEGTICIRGGESPDVSTSSSLTLKRRTSG